MSLVFVFFISQIVKTWTRLRSATFAREEGKNTKTINNNCFSLVQS